MSQPIRVFHLIKSLGRGGAEVLLAEGLKYADREKFTYGYGYFLSHKDAVVPDLEAQGAEVMCFGARTTPGVLGSVFKVAQFLKKWRADVVHCHLPVSGTVGRLAAKLAGVPVLYTEHIDMEQYHPITRWLNLATWGLQQRVVAVSHEAGASARRHAGERVPIQVILNGVDTQSFSPQLSGGASVRAEWSIPEEAPLVGTIAVFREQKRLDLWIQAARQIHDRHPNARFLIVGEGPTRPQLEAEVHRLGVESVVHFAGFQENVRRFLAAFDVYMMSSEREGLPIALLEAMSAGLPVASTAVGGIPGALDRGESGVLVPEGDVEALSEAVSELVASADRRRYLGQAARQTVIKRFSMERMTRELESIYAAIADR